MPITRYCHSHAMSREDISRLWRGYLKLVPTSLPVFINPPGRNTAKCPCWGSGDGATQLRSGRARLWRFRPGGSSRSGLYGPRRRSRSRVRNRRGRGSLAMRLLRRVVLLAPLANETELFAGEDVGGEPVDDRIAYRRPWRFHRRCTVDDIPRKTCNLRTGRSLTWQTHPDADHEEWLPAESLFQNAVVDF
jgi:hypothetical protein